MGLGDVPNTFPPQVLFFLLLNFPEDCGETVRDRKHCHWTDSGSVITFLPHSQTLGHLKVSDFLKLLISFQPSATPLCGFLCPPNITVKVQTSSWRCWDVMRLGTLWILHDPLQASNRYSYSISSVLSESSFSFCYFHVSSCPCTKWMVQEPEGQQKNQLKSSMQNIGRKPIVYSIHSFPWRLHWDIIDM